MQKDGGSSYTSGGSRYTTGNKGIVIKRTPRKSQIMGLYTELHRDKLRRKNIPNAAIANTKQVKNMTI